MTGPATGIAVQTFLEPDSLELIASWWRERFLRTSKIVVDRKQTPV